MNIMKLLAILLVVLFTFPAYAFLPNNSGEMQPFLSKSVNKVIYQKIYLKEKPKNEQVIELLEMLDTFDFSTLNIDIKKKSINMKYFSGFVNLANVISLLKKQGYEIARLE